MIRRCLCVLLYILSSVPAVAALNIESVKFEERMLASNLPFGDIRAIVHSRDGFIWIGGEAGLFRYDGYEYLPIVTASIDGESQKLRHVSVIFEDSRGQIWVAAATGLMRLDRNYNRLVATALSPAGEITINVLRELPDGTLLIGASEGLFKLNPLDYSIKAIINKDRLDGLDEPVVVDIWIQHVHDIWLATPKGLAHYNSETGRLTKITIPGLEHIQANLFTRVVTGGEQGTIWLGTSQGLVNYDPHSHTAKIYAHQPGIASSLANHLIWDIHVDGSGDVWVATDGGGLNYLRAGTDQFVRHQQTPNRKGSIHSNVIRVITQDHHGDLWFGHYPSGISYLDRSLLGIRHIGFTGERHGLTHNSVMSIARDERGNLWLGTDGGGINYLDLQAGTFTPFTHDPNDPTTLASNAVLDLYLEGNTLWAGTWNGGLNKLDTLSGKVTRYPYIRRKSPGFNQDVQLYSNSVWRINADAEGDLWLATHGGGIAYFDPKLAPGTAVFQQYNQDPRHNQGLPAEVAWALEPLPDGDMLIGTANGACRFTKAAGNCPRLPGTGEFMREWVVDIERVGDSLWFASEDGLYRYHLPSQSLTRIGLEDGLADTSVRALAVDDQQRIWLGTKQGISLIDEDNQKITNFERHQGQYIGAINRGAAARTADGELVFGGVNGLFIVSPKTLNSPPPPPTPQLTSAAVFTELVQASSGSTILDKVVNRAQAIHLTHEQRMLTLSFSALNFRDADLNTYAYKLEGFDNDWRQVGRLRQATYTNLDAGSYLFKVKAANAEGVWSETPASIVVNVHPAPWRTWWAYSLYALALFGLGSMIYALGRFKISADHFKKLSVTDPLTHLLNRAGIREVAATYFSNPTLKQHTGIMLLDIDHFKRINDQYGHDAGDAILVQFAELIRRNMRKGDYLGRWGGEEFLLICPSIDAHNLKRIADKLVHVVAIQRMRSQGHTLQVTTSIGFSMVAGNENLDATIAAADKALYLAKAKRNIAVSAQART